ncbi:MAG: hypothetical protein PHE29_14240 [Tissierellia bacterium]|nr:hypothetical protein [Tissierellia bacterium]MDD4780954.1 hypothetical protein [Tissierellia bacterium]
MNITINGDVFFGGEEIYFEDFEVAVDEDLDIPFDDLDEEDYTEDCDLECDGNCYDCEYGDEDDEDDDDVEFDLIEDERFDDYSKEYRGLLTKFVNRIYGADGCPFCLAEVLNEFLDNYLED